MKDTDKAYIAGLIDGEGSIMLQRIHRSTYPSPVVSVTSTTIEILHYLKDIIGHGTITKKIIITLKNISIVIHIF